MKEPNVPYLHSERIIATPEFIQQNNLKLISADEILQRLNDESRKDLFGFESEIYLDFLPLDLVKQDLKPEYVKEIEDGKEQWNVTSFEDAVQDFLDYMNFAWDKAESERGISASRSISKLGAYLYCFGRKDLYELINDRSLYEPYGAPALIAVCEKLSINVPQSLREFAGV